MAMRIPISRVLRLTLYAITPYKPAMASRRPTPPMMPTIRVATPGPSTAAYRCRSSYVLVSDIGRFGLRVRTTSFTDVSQCQRIAARPYQQDHSRDRTLGQRQIHEIGWLPGCVFDRRRDADDLHRCPGAALEADVFAHGIGALPVVARELLIDDGDARCVRGIGRQEAAATHDRIAIVSKNPGKS